MSHPKEPNIPLTPFERFQDLTRRLLAVPKKEAEEVAEAVEDFRGKKRKTPAKTGGKSKTKE